MRLLALGAGLASAVTLSGCAWFLSEPPPPPPPPPPAPVVDSGPPPQRSPWTYEAERAALLAGCQGPAGMRPVATVIKRYATLDWFDVACVSGTIRVRCEMGMCTQIR
ncbi:hypothetical protein [Ideonella livida]|uniref:Lipoprotein n=1 Tax=Ideonella livida TaxID=2707176 RepID=A0A7C9PJD7_9BURK|nr:hypothetical protein [Ideonella livida]NDY92691.1 hypothetical protein [Ideonella livida]